MLFLFQLIAKSDWWFLE